MYTKITSAILIAAVLASGSAAFATTVQGTQVDVGFITEVNEVDRTVTLSDGTVFDVPFGVGLGVFNAGQKVSVAFDQYGTTNLATSIRFGG